MVPSITAPMGLVRHQICMTVYSVGQNQSGALIHWSQDVSLWHKCPGLQNGADPFYCEWRHMFSYCFSPCVECEEDKWLSKSNEISMITNFSMCRILQYGWILLMDLILLRGCCSFMKMTANGVFPTLLSITNQCFNVYMFFLKVRCHSLFNSVSNIGMYVNLIVQPFFCTQV